MRLKAFLTMAMLCLTTHVMAEKKNVTIKMLATSDVHGYFFPYDFIEHKPIRGSLARVSRYVKDVRKEYGKNMLLFDNGDILQGQPTCYYSNFVRKDSINAAALAVNYMQYDAQTIGNHDVETGHDVYDKWISEVNCPMLGANVVDTATGDTYLKPYAVFEREGVRIAVIGMITPAIPYWLHEKLWQGLRFEDMVSASRKWVRHVKDVEKADVVVGLFHSGWDGGITTDKYSEDASMAVAQQVDGFDVIFYGHDHKRAIQNVVNHNGNKVVCIDPGCNATSVADATLTLTLEDGKVVSKNIESSLIDVRDMDIDEGFMECMEDVVNDVTRFVSIKLGRLTRAIRTRDCFFGSSDLNDLIHDIQLTVTGADISINAPLTFNSTIEAGDVTIADMFKLYKYENDLYVMKLRGYEIRKHLEMSYDQWVNTMTSPADHIMLLSDDNTSTRPGFKNLTFNFDSAAGIDYEVDVTKPDGQKVSIRRMSNGEPFVESKWYRVAMNSYRGNGGGELLTKGAGIPAEELESRIIWKSEHDQRYYILKEIQRRKIVTPKAFNNWKFVPEEWTRPALERDRKLLFNE